MVENVASNFQFSHGEKIVTKSEVNQGVMGAWRDAWSWRDGELFVIIEDDVEMSPWWYRALSSFWRKYGHREDIAGVGLQNQEFIVKDSTPRNLSNIVK